MADGSGFKSGAEKTGFPEEDRLDSRMRALASAATSGASPYAAMVAWTDWALHLSSSPARCAALALNAFESAAKVAAFAATPPMLRQQEPPFRAQREDRRFADKAWSEAPFDTYVQAHLALEAWWRAATASLPGVSAHHLRQVEFFGRQVVQALSPANFPLTNPLVLAKTGGAMGGNWMEGADNFAFDAARALNGTQSDAYVVGENLAVTPGEVIFSNHLMELIQYRPATEQVRREPILIVPAWIMKYYILDLTPENSLIRYLTEQGFTVFCISWRNPDAEDRDISLDDYRRDGVMEAFDAVEAICGPTPIHAVGYCLGGTILSIAAAAMGGRGDKRIGTMTLLAAQTDFTEAGELTMFIDDSQLASLEDMMDAQGYLDSKQMSGVFYALRANDMVWQRLVDRYYLGARRPETDLDVWLADATRMPARMHSEYLRWLFLENRLAEGNYLVDGEPIALKDIHAPIFAVGAERDHIAPWRSVHKIALFTTAETTFAITGGGHNTGIVSPPGKKNAKHWLKVVAGADKYEPPDGFAEEPARPGSWWPAWVQWLAARSDQRLVPPPPIGAPVKGYRPIRPAPGNYVRMR